jgi:hypothetical protein
VSLFADGIGPTDRKQDLRQRAQRQASIGNYWAGKCVALFDAIEAIAAGKRLEPPLVEYGPCAWWLASTIHCPRCGGCNVSCLTAPVLHEHYCSDCKLTETYWRSPMRESIVEH